MTIKPPTDDQKLRHDAEKVVGTSTQIWQTEMLHELHIHQIELQIQNEDLRQAQAALETSRDLYLDLYEHAPAGYLTLTVDGTIQNVNVTGATLLGRTREQLLGRRFSARVAVEDLDRWQQVFMRACRNAQAQECDLTLRHDDGTFWHARLNCTQHASSDHRVRISLTDLTEHQQTQRRLSLAASVFTHAREGIMITDAAGNLIEVNNAFSAITGFDREEVLGQNPRLLRSEMAPPEQFAEMWRCLTSTHHWQGEIWNRRRNGELFVARQTITAIVDADGTVQNYVSLFSDITELREHQRQLEYIAHYDPLTHLPNRVLLADRMQHAMTRAVRQNNTLAVAYLDLDGFKAINDAHGHETGDRVLSAVARRMKSTLRDSCTLSRLGGDEFVVLIVDLDQACDSAPLLDRLLLAVSAPLQVDDVRVEISASIGVVYYPQESEISADQLLRQADQAMYQAKLAGKNRFHVFDARHDQNLRGHNARLDRIDRAIREQEFVLHYQPKVNMRTGAVVGVEALIRWQHPEKGLLAPEHFLPLIEGNPLSEELGKWVMSQVMKQIQRWQAAGVQLSVSFNVGARQLQQPDFVASLTSCLNAHPSVQPQMLMIEILETSALEDIEGVSQTIKACAAIGVRFALDDFGTGYSSLSYLKRLPVTQLKIDQMFVQNMLEDPDDLSILQAILSLAATFKREVVAEGVTSALHGERLLQMGCEIAQGYGIAKPMPADAVLTWMAQWQPEPSWHEARA